MANWLIIIGISNLMIAAGLSTFKMPYEAFCALGIVLFVCGILGKIGNE